MALLSDKKVGESVYVKDLYSDKSEYIVIHKGLPASCYHSNCNGVWLMRKYAADTSIFGRNNSYSSATLYLRITNDFTQNCPLFGNVPITYPPYYIDGEIRNTGNYDFPLFAFALSAAELGFTASNNSNLPILGATLDYFKTSTANRKCTAEDGTAVNIWTRSPVVGTTNQAFCVSTTGALTERPVSEQNYFRPVFIIKNKMSVDANNFVSSVLFEVAVNSSLATNLGTLTDGFSCDYSVTGTSTTGSFTVNLMIDDVSKKKFTGAFNTNYSFSLSGEDWLKTANGDHTFKIVVSDGSESFTKTAKFKRNCTAMNFELANPVATENLISKLSVRYMGEIPEDANIKLEACNNANDPEPAWEDVTQRFKTGLVHVFGNKNSENKPALSLRFSAKRGGSNLGGNIARLIFNYE